MAPSKDGRIGSTFYTYDGTWRTAEPSWRLLLAQEENIRGCASAGFPLPQPLADAHLGWEQPDAEERLHRTTSPNYNRPVQETAVEAARAFFNLSWKDSKSSGFCNVQPIHVSLGESDAARWTKLGIGARGTATGTLKILPDKFGDVRNKPNPVEHRPLRVEPSGYTRGPLAHTSAQLVGGFEYTEPATARTATPPAEGGAVQSVGNKLATGFRINNASTPHAPRPEAEHWSRLGGLPSPPMTIVSTRTAVCHPPLGAVAISAAVKKAWIECYHSPGNDLRWVACSYPVSGPKSKRWTKLELVARGTGGYANLLPHLREDAVVFALFK
eukprot:gene9892-8564_t